MTKYWDRLSREPVKSPALEILKTSLNTALGNMLKPTLLWAEDWSRWPPNVSSSRNSSVILWVLHNLYTTQEENNQKKCFNLFSRGWNLPFELSLQQQQATSDLAEDIPTAQHYLEILQLAWLSLHSKSRLQSSGWAFLEVESNANLGVEARQDNAESLVTPPDHLSDCSLGSAGAAEKHYTAAINNSYRLTWLLG